VCYPNSYYVGMSNLGFHSLYHRVSSFHGVRAARFFLERDGRMYSPEAQDPRKGDFFMRRGSLNGFDAIFFTVSFELDYINLLKMLFMSSIPLLAAERDGKRPIILCGGIAPTANRHLLSPICDILFAGDMERGLTEILEALFVWEFRGVDGFFSSVTGIKGVTLDLENKSETVRAVEAHIKNPAHSVVVTDTTEFARMFLIEIIRGCRNTCTFCMTRCAADPPRPANKESVLEHVKRALPLTKKVGLVGPVLTDHQDLPSIVREINSMGGTVSFSSFRADHFIEEIASLVERNGQKTVTFAPETGSEELRRKIGKRLRNDQLLKAVSNALAHGVRRVRLYFMYGLPGEHERDILSIVDLVRETVVLLHGSGLRLHLSVNPFIPKRGTALSLQRPRPVSYYRKAQEVLRQELVGLRGVELKFEPLKQLYLHSLLSIGDRETGIQLCRFFKKGALSEFSKQAEERVLNGYTLP